MVTEGLGRTAVILGTRPEIIKLSPVIRALQKHRADFFVLHTGQHYSYNMDKVFFENLGLDPPAHNIGAGSGTHAEETSKMLVGIEKVLRKDGAGGVLVEGDTNSVLAGSLAAAKLGVRVGHVEAGLRSRDRTMPEELNRIVADQLSDLLFAPTEASRQNLLMEGISPSRIYVTGNTIVDAVYQNLKLASGVKIDSLTAGAEEYMLATVHRQENVDNIGRLRGILSGLEEAARQAGHPVVYPVHPRAAKAIKKTGIRLDPKLVKLCPPADYFLFLRLEQKAKLILTDSGGVQEEACILHVPCVTLRDNTERPETVEVGANILAGAEPKRIVAAARRMSHANRNWRNPFGDGKASRRIVKEWLTA